MYCVMIFFDRVLKLHFHLLTVMLYLRIRGKGCLIYCFIIDILKSRYFDFGKSLEDGDKKAYST